MTPQSTMPPRFFPSISFRGQALSKSVHQAVLLIIPPGCKKLVEGFSDAFDWIGFVAPVGYSSIALAHQFSVFVTHRGHLRYQFGHAAIVEDSIS
jgi:hypothetical protein